MVSLSSRISPRTSTVIFLDRSPFATAVVTAAMFRTWPVRFPAIELTESVRSFHVPARDRRRHGRDVPHLRRQVAGHRVHGVGQVLPRTGDAAHVGLAAELP